MSPALDVELQIRVERFLYDEAELLDTGKLREWLELFTPDCEYWIPLTETRDTREEATQTQADLPAMLVGKDGLDLWIRRLETGLAFPEEPFSRTRRFVSNVRVRRDGDGDIRARANIAVYQSRLEDTQAWFVGEREDELVETDGSYAIRRRTVRFDQRLVPRAITLLY